MTNELDVSRQAHGGELATTAAAAQARAAIEAAYVVAQRRRRNIGDARAMILEACKRPNFAESARYNKPVAGHEVVGPSIRFAETALAAWGNIQVDTRVVFEDDERRIIHISTLDLETNICYGQDVNLLKVVERRKLHPGQAALSERINSSGQQVFLVEATEDELANKSASAQSKVIRNCGLRLIPRDIIDEAMNTCEVTLKGSAGDPAERLKKLSDAFGGLGIRPSEVEKYLGHALSQVNKSELSDLRVVYETIRDGESKWSDYLAEKDGLEVADTQPTRRQKIAKRVRDAAQHALGANTDTTPASSAPAPVPVPAPAPASGPDYAHSAEDLADAADAKGVAAPPSPGEPPPGEDGLEAVDLETGEIQTPAPACPPEKPRRRGRPRKTEQAGLPFVDQPDDLGTPETPAEPPATEPEQPPDATDADGNTNDNPDDSEIETPPAAAPAPTPPSAAAKPAAKPAAAPTSSRLKARDMLTRMTSALGSDTPEILQEKLTELVTAVNAVQDGGLADIVQKWTKGIAVNMLGPTMLRKIITEAVPVAKEILLPKESKP